MRCIVIQTITLLPRIVFLLSPGIAKLDPTNIYSFQIQISHEHSVISHKKMKNEHEISNLRAADGFIFY